MNLSGFLAPCAITFMLGIITGVYLDITEWPKLSQYKFYAQFAKISKDQNENMIAFQSLYQSLEADPNERLICVSKDKNWIVSLSAGDTNNIKQDGSLNIINSPKEINLRDCCLASTLEQNDCNLTKGLARKIIDKL